MEFLGILLFIVSLLGILGLFALKRYEITLGRVLFPSLRQEADVRALAFKTWLHKTQEQLSHVGPITVNLTQLIIHDAALLFAAFGRFLERKAHEVADRASYKHRFERRESTSSFLRQVGEYKNGRSSEDAQKDDQQS